MSKSDRLRAKESAALFRSGCNCAQSVAAVYADTCKVSKEQFMKILSFLGRGIAHQQEICGVVVGALIVMGMWYGSADKEDRKEGYQKAERFCKGFRMRYGTLRCRELCQRHSRRVCAAYVAYATILLEHIQKEKQANGETIPD